MKTSIIQNLENSYKPSSLEPEHNNQNNQNTNYPYCRLEWRMGHLLVLPPGQHKQPYLPAFDHLGTLVKCLQATPAKIVRIDPRIGEAKVKTWVEACNQAGKPIYLNISSLEKLEKTFQSPNYFSKPVQLTFEWLSALLFAIALLPIWLIIMAWSVISGTESRFSQTWHVGKRGRVIKLWKFRTVSNENGTDIVTPFGAFLQKSGLENLPHLINVLRGEISLFGHRGWSLEDALAQNLELTRNGKGLLGLSGTWKVEPEASLLHLDSQTL